MAFQKFQSNKKCHKNRSDFKRRIYCSTPRQMSPKLSPKIDSLTVIFTGVTNGIRFGYIYLIIGLSPELSTLGS